MRYRLGFLFLTASMASLSGCATAPRMSETTPIFGTQAWNQAPAPAQRTVATTVPSLVSANHPADPAARPVGLAKYFPGLQRPPVEPPKLVARYRPTWFGLRPPPAAAKPNTPTTYMTDARAGLNNPATASEPSTLPVALQVPAPQPSSDRAVKPANVEQPINPTPENSQSVAIPDFGGQPSKPGEDDVNPLPPAIEPSNPSTAVASRMPDMPEVDPQEKKGSSKPSEAAMVADSPTPAPMTPPTPTAPNDGQAQKAITRPPSANIPPGLPEPTVPASYVPGLVASETVGFHKLTQNKVLASPQTPPKPSPQVAPSPQARPSPQVKPTSQAVPTSLSKPSPQASPSAQSCESTPTATTWQRPCLRRLVRKVCCLGEYANPPTAAPH